MKAYLNFSLSFLLTAVSLLSQAQNREEFFRRLPLEGESVPLWAAEMYSADPDVRQVEQMRRSYWESRDYIKDIHERNYKTWISYVAEYVNGEGRIRMPKNLGFEGTLPGNVNRAQAESWIPIGPMDTYNQGLGNYPVSWQCNAYTLDVCASNPNVVFAGIEGGDLFKSVDKGLSWTPVTEGLGIRTVTRVAVAPSDENYVYFESGGNLYKSTDGGSTWGIIYALGEGATAIAVHPTDPNLILYSTFDGLYRSTNGGIAWTTIHPTRVWDVVFHATDPSVVFMVRQNNTLKRAELYKSTDTGATFSIRSTGWFSPSDPANASDQGALIGVTPADPNRVYVALIGQGKASDTGWIGMYRSNDAGETWANPIGQDGAPYDPDNYPSLATGNMNGTGIYQGYYDFVIAVSHNNPDRVWVGVTAFNQSDDGGLSWKRIGAYGASTYDVGWIHPDLQEMCVVGDDIWLSSDGGINYSSDEFQTHESRKYGIYNSDFWGYGQGWNYDIQVGGRYHNGNTGYYQSYTSGNHLRLGGAEAPTGFVDPFLERQAYFSDISDVVLPATFDEPVGGGRNLSQYPQSAYWDSESSELLWHPNYADIMYMGIGDRFEKSTDGGLTFEPTFTFPSGSVVFEIESARDNPDLFYAVVRNGGSCDIWKSTDGGVSFANIGHPGTSMYKMEIAVNPVNADELWVIHANGSQVFRTLNSGLSWSDQFQGSLSGASFRDICFAGPNAILLTTNQGIHSRVNGEVFWQDCGLGLPARINTLNLYPHYRSSVLRMVDKGKGIWEAPFPADFLPFAEPMTRRPEVYCIQDTVQLDCHSLLDHSGASWSWSVSPAPAYVSDLNARNPKIVLGDVGSYDVSLTVTDGAGNQSSKTVNAMLTGISACGVDGGPGASLECFDNGDYAFSEDLGVTTNVLTISAWVKPDGIQGDYTGIAISEDGSAAGFNFRPGNELGYHWPGGAWWWSSGLTVPVNEWSHVAMVATPTQMRVYLNGVEAVHTTNLDPVDLNRMVLGSYRGWGGRNLNGQLDEVRIWNRALSREELREMRHLTMDQAALDADPDLLVYYQFNEDVPYLINKKNIPVHGTLNGNATLNLEGAPVGSGTSDRLFSSSGGVFILPNTETVLDIPPLGITFDDIVVSRLDGPAPMSPDQSVDSYFIINNYGTSSAAQPSLVELHPLNYVAGLEYTSGYSGLDRYSREENATTGLWSLDCAGGAAFATTGFDASACGTSWDRQLLFAEPFCIVEEEGIDLCLGDTYDCANCTDAAGSPTPMLSEDGIYFDLDTSGACDGLTIRTVSTSGPYGISWSSSGTTITATPGFELYNWYLDGELISSGTSNVLVTSQAGELTVEGTLYPCQSSYSDQLGCYGDLNGDGIVSVGDLLTILAEFGCTMDCGATDLNEDGQVSSGDILALLAIFGSSCW